MRMEETACIGWCLGVGPKPMFDLFNKRVRYAPWFIYLTQIVEDSCSTSGTDLCSVPFESVHELQRKEQGCVLYETTAQAIQRHLCRWTRSDSVRRSRSMHVNMAPVAGSNQRLLKTYRTTGTISPPTTYITINKRFRSRSMAISASAVHPKMTIITIHTVLPLSHDLSTQLTSLPSAMSGWEAGDICPPRPRYRMFPRCRTMKYAWDAAVGEDRWRLMIR